MNSNHDPPTITVLDLPQLHEHPTFDQLQQTVNLLNKPPTSWDSSPNHDVPLIEEAGIPAYLTRLISSPLTWLADTEREAIWESASKRLSERAGRSALPSFTRTLEVPIAHGKRIFVKIREPGLTGDHLGHKTWGAGYVMARLLHELQREELDMGQDRAAGTAGRGLRILELGAGTGLAGIAAAAVWKEAEVCLTDLPGIVENLASNVKTNEAVIDVEKVTTGVMDWADLGPWQPESKEFNLILAADSLYADEHPALLAGAVAASLSSQGVVFTVMPERDMHMGFHEMLRLEMDNRSLRVREETREIGMDDWHGGRPDIFWCCTWTWKDT